MTVYVILAGCLVVDLFALAWLAAYWPQDPRKGGLW